MATNVNTSKSMKQNKTNAELTAELAAAKKSFSEEKTVKFSVPKVLESLIGPVLFLGVNGVSVNIPVDGKEYEIPETLAAHGKEYINNLK